MLIDVVGVNIVLLVGCLYILLECKRIKERIKGEMMLIMIVIILRLLGL